MLIKCFIKGNQLPYHMYASPYETKQQQRAAVVVLQREFEVEMAENLRAAAMGAEVPFPDLELKVRKIDRKGGIDWYIYCHEW